MFKPHNPTHTSDSKPQPPNYIIGEEEKYQTDRETCNRTKGRRRGLRLSKDGSSSEMRLPTTAPQPVVGDEMSFNFERKRENFLRETLFVNGFSEF